MKKSLLATILTAFFFVLSFVVTAQTNSPGANDGKGDTPSGPGGAPTPGDPSMGDAPIGGGTLILIALGAAYGGKKVYKIVKDNLEELEN
jgi:hypothetical protein